MKLSEEQRQAILESYLKESKKAQLEPNIFYHPNFRRQPISMHPAGVFYWDYTYGAEHDPYPEAWAKI